MCVSPSVFAGVCVCVCFQIICVKLCVYERRPAADSGGVFANSEAQFGSSAPGHAEGEMEKATVVFTQDLRCGHRFHKRGGREREREKECV